MFSRGKADKETPGTEAAAPPRRLGDLLLDQGLVTEEQLAEAVAEHERSGEFLGQALVRLGFVTQEIITSCVVKQCKVPHLSLLDYDISPDVLSLVPREVCVKHGLLPIDKLGRILTIAMVDPLDLDALDAVRQSCPDLRIKPILCNWHHFDTVMQRVHPDASKPSGGREVTAASLGLGAVPSKAPPPAPPPQPPKAEEAPAPASVAEVRQQAVAPGLSASELGEVFQASLRGALGEVVQALEPRAAAPAPVLDTAVLAAALRETMQESLAGLATEIRAAAPAAAVAPVPAMDAAALGGALREAMQESLAGLATEIRAAAPAAAPATPATDAQALAAVLQEGLGAALREGLASMAVEVRAANEAPPGPGPEAMVSAIHDSVVGAMQEAMASMMVQLRAVVGKKESGISQEALSEALYASVREAFEIARQQQEEQGNRLAEIAEATLQAVQQTSHIMESSTVAAQGRRDLERSKRNRHASVAPFGAAGPAEGGELNEADERVRDALESEHPLESLTLDRFLPGAANGFTYKLAQAVAASPGGEYNPFFLFGRVGTGKTHLISGMGNAVLTADAARRVGYVSASHFSRRLAEALKDNAVDAFRENYCHWDVLILDDIQFLGGRVEAQEEFFHIFNVLHQQHRQIIIASDKAPDRLGLLEQRLVSRFASGIVAELRAPEWDTRMRILRQCAGAANTAVPEEILSLVAMRVPDDVRKMTGALRKILAFSALVGQEMSVEMATEILSHLGAEQAA